MSRGIDGKYFLNIFKDFPEKGLFLPRFRRSFAAVAGGGRAIIPEKAKMPPFFRFCRLENLWLMWFNSLGDGRGEDRVVSLAASAVKRRL